MYGINLFLAAHDLSLTGASHGKVESRQPNRLRLKRLQKLENNLIPRSSRKSRLNKELDSSVVGDFGFRPLTEEEKKAFVDALDADGKRILRELAGEKSKLNAKKRSAGSAVVAPAFNETT